MTEKRARVRLLCAVAVLLSALVGLGLRLAFLHVGGHDETRARLERKGRVERKLLAARGNVYDRNGRGNTLALSIAVKDVCVNPAVILANDQVPEIAGLLSRELGVPADVVATKCARPGRKFEYIKRFVPEDELHGLRDADSNAVFFRKQIVRNYPQHEFMCHVLGFVNYEGTGSAGVEQRADPYLRACHGMVENRVDALQQDLYWDEGRYIPAIRGADVTLTLDQNVQFMVEEALDAVMEEYAAGAAWAIVERVRTGEILAMASRPAYNLNEFVGAEDEQRRNRAIACNYEPGSTFKAVMFAAAFNEGLVREDRMIDCEDGAWYHGGRLLHDYKPFDALSVADGLKRSSNILTAKLSLLLGEKRAYRYLKAFGIGEKMGIDLPAEERGILHHPSDWSAISLSRIAIGQGVAVTALQMLGVYCAIANDGFLMRPYVIKEIRAADGTVLLNKEPEVLRRPITMQTAARMRRLLARVTQEGGTGWRARVDGFGVAGKTGTAQKPEDGGYSKTDYIASFVGFLPATDPDIAVIVVVDTPQRVHGGGRVAGPVFSSIAEQAARYLNIAPVVEHRLARNVR